MTSGPTPPRGEESEASGTASDDAATATSAVETDGSSHDARAGSAAAQADGAQADGPHADGAQADGAHADGAPVAEQPVRAERTTYLGQYDEFEAAIVLDILESHGIFAFPKVPLDEAEAAPYGMIMSDRGVIMVDADKLDEALTLIAVDLPAHLEAIAVSMDDIDVGEAPDEDVPPDTAPDEEARPDPSSGGDATRSNDA